MSEVVFFDKRPNNLPAEFWDEVKASGKWRELAPDEIVVLKRHPRFGFKTKIQVGDSLDMTKPKATHDVALYGTHALSPNRWTLRWGNKNFQVGFAPYEIAQGNQSRWGFRRVLFNNEGISVLRGSNSEDCEVWKYIQLHAKFKGGFFQTGRQWDFAEDKLDKSEALELIDIEEKRSDIVGIVKGLTSDQFNILASTSLYERAFLGVPQLRGDYAGTKAYIYDKIKTAEGVSQVTKALKNLDPVEDIKLIDELLMSRKAEIVQGSLILDGNKVFTAKAPFSSSDTQGIAIEIYSQCAGPNGLSWLDAYKAKLAEKAVVAKGQANTEKIRTKITEPA